MLLRRWSAIPILVALPIVLGLNTGCDVVFSLDRAEEAAAPDPNAHTCRCSCFAGTQDELGRDFDVCLPPALNPNLGGATATPADLTADCATRVKGTMLGVLQQCATGRVQRRLETLGDQACTCDSFFDQRFVDTCNGDCLSVPLALDCSNEDDATSVAGLDPLCLAEPTMSARQTMGRVLLGDRTTCAVTGEVVVGREGETHSRPADGVVEIAGAPCPGGGCNVGMTYRLDDVGDFGFSSFAGFASVTVKNIQASGASVSLATLDADGNAAFPSDTTVSSGRGTRLDEELFGVFSDERTRSFVGSNAGPVDLGVDWVGNTCSLRGTVLGSIEEADTSILVNMEGTILNAPPTANAGPVQAVECTSAAGGPVTLTAAASSDPDNNIVFTEWRIGGPAGAEVLDPEEDGVVTVAQALGTSTIYALTVVDAFLAVSRDATAVSVVDTTAPVISGLAATPTSLWPPNHKMKKVTVAVSATDTCGAASCAITSVSSNEPVNGKGDGNTSPDWQITGPLTVDLRAERSGGGSGRVYTITVSCGDPTGNVSTGTATVTVAH